MSLPTRAKLIHCAQDYPDKHNPRARCGVSAVTCPTIHRYKFSGGLRSKDRCSRCKDALRAERERGEPPKARSPLERQRRYSAEMAAKIAERARRSSAS